MNHPFPRIADACYERIRLLVYEYSRIHLGDKKKELVQSRLGKRLQALRVSSFEAYCDFVESPRGRDELEHLINAISTNHTYFFREPAHFTFLKEVAIPQFLKTGLKKPLRLWSAACASGEEAYSCAITLGEYARVTCPFAWQIDCTDISTRILELASEGIYQTHQLTQLPEDILKRYFEKDQLEELFYVRREIKERMHFRVLHLLNVPYPFSYAFDVIFCRNVMIYFDQFTQRELIGYLSGCLRPGGYLVIGHSENLAGIPHALKSVQHAIYQKMA